MTQRHVEIAMGRLVTDEDAWRALGDAPSAFVASLKLSGLELSAAEEEALMAVDPHACARFARTLDPRIRKISLLPPSRAHRGRARGER